MDLKDWWYIGLSKCWKHNYVIIIMLWLTWDFGIANNEDPNKIHQDCKHVEECFSFFDQMGGFGAI